MKKIEIEGDVFEIRGTGLGGSFPTGNVEFSNDKGKWDNLTDLLYREMLNKKVKITIEEVE